MLIQGASGAVYTELNTPDSLTWNDAPWASGVPLGLDSDTTAIAGLLRGGGTLTIDGTSVDTTPGSLLVGWQGNFTLNIVDGLLTVGDYNTEGLSVGESGIGTVNQSGGVVTAAAVRIGRGASGVGDYHLNGGALRASLVTKGFGTGSFHFNGGVLQAGASSGVWIPTGLPLVVEAGGAIIDTQGFDVTIHSTLIDDGFQSGGGLRKVGSPTNTTGVLRLAAANTYTGDTYIEQGYLVTNVSNALPETTVLHFTNLDGAVSRMDMTATSQKIRGLVSGLPTATTDIYYQSGAKLEVATQAGDEFAFYGDIGGGDLTFTKSGEGKQILAGRNNFSGLTTIEAGTLQIGDNNVVSGQNLGTGSYVINAGAKLIFSRNADVMVFGNQGISGDGDLEFAGQSNGYFSFRAEYAAALSNTGRTIVNFDTSETPLEWFRQALWLEKDNVLSNSTLLDIQAGKVFLRAQTGNGITMRGLEGNAGTYITTERAEIQKVTINVPAGSTHTFAGTIGADSYVGTPTNNNIALFKAGAGTQVFTAMNTLAGGTTVLGGTLEIAGGGWIVDSIVNNSKLVYSRNVATVINGSFGNVNISGPGSVTFSTTAPDAYYSIQGGQTYTGRTIINMTGPNDLGQSVFVEGFDNSLPGETVVEIVAGNVYQRNGNQTIAGLTGSGTWNGDLAGAHTLTLNVSGAHSFAGSLGETSGGVLSVVKSGPGTQTLAGVNTYTGPTLVSEGRLDLIGSVISDITVSDGAAIGGEGSGAGMLTFTGSSTLYFDPTTSESLTVTSADATGAVVTLQLAIPTTNATGVVVLNAPGGITGTAGLGGNFRFTGRGATYLNEAHTQLLFDYMPATILWKGNDGTNPTYWDIDTTSNWVNDGSPDRFFASDTAIFDDTASTFTVEVKGGSIPVGTVTFNNESNPYSVKGDSLQGFGPLIKNGAAKVTISNDNGFSAGTFINAGSIQLGDGINGTGSLGGGTIQNNGALILDYGFNDKTLANVITGSGMLTKNGDGTVIITGESTYSGGTTINSGFLQLGDGLNGSGTLGTGVVVNNANLVADFGIHDASIGNSISGSGSFIKNGVGTTTLEGNNTYSGATYVFVGTLEAKGGAALPDNGAVEVSNGATLRINDDETIGSLFSNGIVNLNDASLTLAGDDNSIATGVITGTGGLVKRGSGTATLAAANTYSGMTKVEEGVLEVGVGDTTVDIGQSSFEVSSGARLVFSRNAFNGVAFTTQSISGEGDVEFTGGSTGYFTFRAVGPVYSGNLTNSGRTIVNYDPLGGSAQWFHNGLWLEKEDVLSHSTVLDIQSGKVFLRNQGGLGITMAGLTGAEGTFVTTERTDIQKMTINTPSGSYAYDGVIGADTFAGSPTNGNISVIKTGVGTQILNGGNTYVGPTEILDGTLVVNGSLSAASTVNVRSGGTLSGDGFVGVINVLENGTVSPGSGVGNLTAMDLTLNEFSHLVFELGMPEVFSDSDFLSVSGTLILDGILHVTPRLGFDEGRYPIIEYAGFMLDQGLAIDPAFLSQYPGSYIDTAVDGEVHLVVVPEPGAAGLLLASLGVMAALRRRRK